MPGPTPRLQNSNRGRVAGKCERRKKNGVINRNTGGFWEDTEQPRRSIPSPSLHRFERENQGSHDDENETRDWNSGEPCLTGSVRKFARRGDEKGKPDVIFKTSRRIPGRDPHSGQRGERPETHLVGLLALRLSIRRLASEVLFLNGREKDQTFDAKKGLKGRPGSYLGEDEGPSHATFACAE